MPYSGEAAMDALVAFLQNGTYGFNVQLATTRTDLGGIDTDALPDVAEWSTYAWNPSKSTKWPHGNVDILSVGDDIDPGSRMYPVEFMVTIAMPSKMADSSSLGQEATVKRTMVRYHDTLRRLLLRSNHGTEGVNLANGASGRVHHALVGRAEFGVLVFAGRNPAMQAGVTVLMMESYP